MEKVLILLAGGSGSRMHQNINKVLLRLDGREVILRSMDAFLSIVDRTIVVYRQEDEKTVKELFSQAYPDLEIVFVCGGATRQESVFNGLSQIHDSSSIVLIHDAARCLVDYTTITTALKSAVKNGSGIPAVSISDTIKFSYNGSTIDHSPDRSRLFSVQTPQCFQYQLIYDAYCRSIREAMSATDDASVLEYTGTEVYLTDGNKNNIKLTTPEDLSFAEFVLSKEADSMFRIGHGYDVHRLVEERDLFLCGVKIPYVFGLLGHSDADVALHALMDAMLGALSLGDIGHLFPDTDDKYKGVSSLSLLDVVNKQILSNGYKLSNCDITIIAQKPKLAPYIEQMKKQIAATLKCNFNQISVKATTTEKLGFEGRQEGISAHCVCLLTKV